MAKKMRAAGSTGKLEIQSRLNRYCLWCREVGVLGDAVEAREGGDVKSDQSVHVRKTFSRNSNGDLSRSGVGEPR
jgi:hypothetical protein